MSGAGKIIRLILSDKANKMSDSHTRMMRAEIALSYIEYFLKRNPDWECITLACALEKRIKTFLRVASEARDESVTLDSPYFARLAMFAWWSSRLNAIMDVVVGYRYHMVKVREVFHYDESVYEAFKSLGDWRKPRRRLSVAHRARLARARGKMYRAGHKV